MNLYKFSERKRINNLYEIYDGKKLLTKEFINLDLSNLDLSIIPITEWEDCVFYNTSFKNTGIKFIPNKLRLIPKEEREKIQLFGYLPIYKYINYCDFSDNDLSYLKKIDFYTTKFEEVCTYGCDFSNTGINFLKTLRNIKLDSSYGDYNFNDNYWKFEYGVINWPDFIDINTIVKNPFLKVPSFRVLNAIYLYMIETDRKYKFTEQLFKQNKTDFHGRIIISNLDEKEIKYVENIVKKCEEFLEYDKEGYGKKLYYKLLPFFSLEDKYEFFKFSIKNVHIKNVNFEDIPVEVLRYYEFFNNTFENVTLNNSIKDLLRLWDERFLDIISGYENEYKSLYLPNINYSSWQENEYAKKRVSGSAITFFTKVYLELSRRCNANCLFCRNHSFDECEYNLENIKKMLYEIKDYLNAVIIGGGEPTLKLDDVKKLRSGFENDRIDWHMFSNGTNPAFVYDDYIMDNFKLNISRHAVDDEENANVFRVDSKKIMTSNDLEKLNIRNGKVTLNAVCFKGGLDSFDKIINYIKYARDIGCKKVLIQDLQREISLGNNIVTNNNMCIDEKIFFLVREYLKANGYKEKHPIYATGGYVSYILTNKEGFSVTLQNYINQQELDKQWIKSIKRTFDLSIDPSGNLYENWNQKTGLVKKLNKYF